MLLHLGDPPGPAHAPKLANLSRLAAAGLPVPPGLGFEPDALADPDLRARLADLLQGGPVIVRAALAREDTSDSAAAGLGLSVPDCRDLADIDRAAARILDAGGAAQLLVQRQVPRRWLVVAALDRDGAVLELHGPEVADALATGVTPAFTGPLERAPPELRAPLAGLFDQVASAMPEAPALDLELVVDPAGAPWLVQARPLTRPLSPDWPEFLAEVAPGRPRIPDLPGLWRLDAEHNPAPISPAHAGVIAWLAARGARSRVLAGWLYDPAPPVDPAATSAPPPLASAPPSCPEPSPSDPPPPASAPTTCPLGHPSPSDPPPPASAPPSCPEPSASDPPPPADPPATCPPGHPIDLAAALRDLRADTDAARRDLRAFSARLADASDLSALLDLALEHLRTTLARHAAHGSRRPAALAPDLAAPLCLRERDDHLDVLPLAWDIASPVLADMLAPRPATAMPDLPADPAAAASLLRELDDHLFALGLAPTRRLYLAAGERLGLGDAVFLLAPDELRAALRGAPLPDLADRRAAQARRAGLTPPLALLDGRPVPEPPRRRLRGLPAGPSFRGPLAQRRDLADLLARSPGPEAIVVLPALTAQAAVALRELGLRAVCCEHGGALSHAALMVRELGLSALIGCRGCTGLPDGALAELDARLGRLRLA